MALDSQFNRPLQQQLYEAFLTLVIYPNLWVAAAITSLVPFVQVTLGLAWDWQPIALIFSAALLPYNVDRVADTHVQKIPDQRAQAFFQHSGVWGLLLGASLATGLLIYAAPPAVRLVSLGGLLPLIYGVPLFPWQGRKGLRWYRIKDIPGAKAWIVCGIITYAVVAVPLAYAGAPFDASAALTSLFLLIFVGSNSHMFDVRDIESDAKKGVVTMPVLWGTEGTRLFWIIANLSLIAALSWGWRVGLQIPDPAIALPLILITLTYILTLGPNTARNVYNIWIDGCLFLPILWRQALSAIA